ncbi:MAG: SNF2-related protein [Opitutales bacterium]
MIDPTLPDLSRDTLVELAGWAVLKEARALYEGGAVHGVRWEAPLLTGEVGAGKGQFHPRLNLRSLTFAENRCNCPAGRRGQVCAHAIAACLALRAQSEEAIEEATANTAAAASGEDRSASAEGTEARTGDEPPRIQSIEQDPAGTPLVLRFLLPPNLAQAAPRDAIMTKVEVAVGRELMPPEHLPRGRRYALTETQMRAYALLEGWCGGRPRSLLQLKRAQLGQLLGALRGEPVFAWVKQPDRPLAWENGRLTEVEPLLEEASPSPAAPPPPSAAPAGTAAIRSDPESPPPSIAVPRRGAPRVNPAPPRPSAVEAMKERLARGEKPGTQIVVDGSTQFLAVQLPDRESPLYEPARKLLREHDFRPEPSNGKYWLRDRHKTLNFLAAHESTLRDELGAWFTDNFRQRTARLKRIQLQTRVTQRGGEFSLVLSLDAPGLEPAEIYRALASQCHYLVQGETIHLFDPADMEKLARAQQALAGEKARAFTPHFETRVRSAQLRDAEQILEELDEEIALPRDWKQRSAALGRLDRLAAPPVGATLDGLLRTYQRIGTAWLWHLYRHELGGILADEMGLGKTIQALGLLECAQAKSARPGTPCLVVCPASLLGNWEREAGRFAPHLTVFRHHGTHRLERPEDATCHDLVITSYATLARDAELLDAVEWNIVLADEAQHIKNRRTQAATALRRQNAHARFILTGTPVENSLDDLRSLFAFLLPGYLAKMPPGTTGDDRAWYDRRHREQAAPYILRRTKQLVAPELPEKIEQVIHCDLTPKQQSLYQATQVSTERAIAELELAGKSEAQVRVAALAQLLRLRQVCAEPRLLDDSLAPADSAKLGAFAEILDEALDGGHRILVFSQFVKVLAHLQTFLKGLQLPYCYLDGKTRDRLAECDRFNEDPSIPVFLISLKAGGTGLNLTGADTVVHFDPWWNPAVEDQATDRAHRIGQTRTVTSYKLITTGTVEEKVLALQAEKSALLRDILDESAASTAKVGLADIRALLTA